MMQPSLPQQPVQPGPMPAPAGPPSPQMPQAPTPPMAYGPQPPKKKTGLIITIVILVVLVIGAAVGVTLYFVLGRSSGESTQQGVQQSKEDEAQPKKDKQDDQSEEEKARAELENWREWKEWSVMPPAEIIPPVHKGVRIDNYTNDDWRIPLEFSGFVIDPESKGYLMPEGLSVDYKEPSSKGRAITVYMNRVGGPIAQFNRKLQDMDNVHHNGRYTCGTSQWSVFEKRIECVAFFLNSHVGVVTKEGDKFTEDEVVKALDGCVQYLESTRPPELLNLTPDML